MAWEWFLWPVDNFHGLWVITIGFRGLHWLDMVSLFWKWFHWAIDGFSVLVMAPWAVDGFSGSLA